MFECMMDEMNAYMELWLLGGMLIEGYFTNIADLGQPHCARSWNK